MANWWDKNLTDKQKFRLQEPQDASLLNVVSAVPNPVGDVASGLLAAQDVSKGNYGSAALNALGLLPFVPSMGAITAWHGSPAMFDKFDASKIGTGAGSVYGAGGYFSESPQYAAKFQEPSKGAEVTAFQALKNYSNRDDAINSLKSMEQASFTDLGKKHLQEAINLLKSNKVTSGNLYKVDIPDELLPKMINWDEPFTKQPKDIQNLFQQFDPVAARDTNRVDNYMRRWLRDDSTVKQLADMGYTGVKYQDSAKNYVVYDPSKVKILDRK